MCRYYAHIHPCGHTTTVFAAFCAPAQLIQRPCPGGSGGEIWQSLRMEHVCSRCQPEGNVSTSSNTKATGKTMETKQRR